MPEKVNELETIHLILKKLTSRVVWREVYF